MYQFTALLNLKEGEAYLSGNQNCLLSLSKAEIYTIAKSTDGLKQTAPYAVWANNLDSIDDFDFHIFQNEDRDQVKINAHKYAVNSKCTKISRGQPTIVR
jgi:hypothetical protein